MKWTFTVNVSEEELQAFHRRLEWVTEYQNSSNGVDLNPLYLQLLESLSLVLNKLPVQALVLEGTKQCRSKS